MQVPVLGCTFLTLSDREESTAENRQFVRAGIGTDHQGTDDQCPDDRMPSIATHQCCQSVPPVSAQGLCQSVPPVSAQK
ncbi:unnamed protein product [Staurois parvus]|uniref:Uncharacterized protein n=1 Tax=Staurois parvus TaxID=386267 RepID=A0ABN9ETK8_9NEOB|nr:unnamed protein product [Staurois parvus]